MKLSKQFNPSQLFGGMNSTATVAATNSGPLIAYNASVTTSVDSFDSLLGSAPWPKTAQTVPAGGNLTFSYRVKTSQVSGNLTAAAVSATFFFGGAFFSTQGVGPKVNIYQPVGVTITTNPVTPVEGRNFTINFRLTNPSGVPVSNVLFTLPVPSGLKLSHLNNAQLTGATLTMSTGSLAPHSSISASAVAVASSGIVVPFDKAKLTFTFSGVSINGGFPSKTGIAIGEDATARYLIPTGFVLLALIATAFYVRWKASPSVPASPK
jgi:hypothetical protein